MTKKIRIGRKSTDTIVEGQAFYPKCPSCEEAPFFDGWCHHIDVPINEDDGLISLAINTNRRDYCGIVVAKGKCPLGGKP